MMPEAGGSYRFLREMFPGELGRFLSFLFVFQLMVSAPLSVASGCIGLSQYAGYLAPSLRGVWLHWGQNLRRPRNAGSDRRRPAGSRPALSKPRKPPARVLRALGDGHRHARMGLPRRDDARTPHRRLQLPSPGIPPPAVVLRRPGRRNAGRYLRFLGLLQRHLPRRRSQRTRPGPFRAPSSSRLPPSAAFTSHSRLPSSVSSTGTSSSA